MEVTFVRLYRVGGVVRRTWRRILWLRDLEYDENKGWFDSVFLVQGTQRNHDELQDIIDRYNNHKREDNVL